MSLFRNVASPHASFVKGTIQILLFAQAVKNDFLLVSQCVAVGRPINKLGNTASFSLRLSVRNHNIHKASPSTEIVKFVLFNFFLLFTNP